MNKITVEEWRKHVVANCEDSYNLAVCLATLLGMEEGAKDVSKIHSYGISGAQAEMAMGFIEQYEVEGLNKHK
jgi:hypothetical protein